MTINFIVKLIQIYIGSSEAVHEQYSRAILSLILEIVSTSKLKDNTCIKIRSNGKYRSKRLRQRTSSFRDLHSDGNGGRDRVVCGDDNYRSFAANEKFPFNYNHRV